MIFPVNVWAKCNFLAMFETQIHLVLRASSDAAEKFCWRTELVRQSVKDMKLL